MATTRQIAANRASRAARRPSAPSIACVRPIPQPTAAATKTLILAERTQWKMILVEAPLYLTSPDLLSWATLDACVRGHRASLRTRQATIARILKPAVISRLSFDCLGRRPQV
jgi:hypothetical protein